MHFSKSKVMSEVKEYIANLSKAYANYIQPRKISRELDQSESDVQECLDCLEKEGELERFFKLECPNRCEESIISNDLNSNIVCSECEYKIENEELLRCIEEVYYSRIDQKEDTFFDVTKYLNNSISNIVDFPKSKKQVTYVEEDIKEIEKELIEMNKKIEKPKIFISHCEKDARIVTKFVKLLKDIGIERNADNIFCSSYEGLGVPPGKLIGDLIKNEFDKNILVISIFTPNYKNSVPCIYEMGASWAKSKDLIPIVVPPCKFEDIQGFLSNSKGIKINNPSQLNELRNTIVEFCNISHDSDYWERDRNEFLEDINLIIDSMQNVE